MGDGKINPAPRALCILFLAINYQLSALNHVDSERQLGATVRPRYRRRA
jgi:hypothetical protein